MKVSRAQAETNRERVIDESSRLFRERGFAGVGLNELMEAAGLTRGGFYGQFESKEELMRLALAHGLRENVAMWTGLVARAQVDPLHSFIDAYLSEPHVGHVGDGCVLAALGPDSEREGNEVRAVFGEGARELALLIEALLPHKDQSAQADKAWACLASLVGALVLARAVGHKADSERIRRATSEMLRSAFPVSHRPQAVTRS